MVVAIYAVFFIAMDDAIAYLPSGPLAIVNAALLNIILLTLYN